MKSLKLGNNIEREDITLLIMNRMDYDEALTIEQYNDEITIAWMSGIVDTLELDIPILFTKTKMN